MINAECHTDDFVLKAAFDAEPWFAQATDSAITDLAKCEWRGDYPADEVAHYCRFGEINQNIGSVLDDGLNKEDMGFECVVEEGEAMRWVRDNRPVLFLELCNITDTEPSDHDEIPNYNRH